MKSIVQFISGGKRVSMDVYRIDMQVQLYEEACEGWIVDEERVYLFRCQSLAPMAVLSRYIWEMECIGVRLFHW